MTEPTPEPSPLGEDAFTDEELDAIADDDEPLTNMRAARKLRAQNARLRMRLRESDANRQAAEEAREKDLARLAEYERAAVEQAAGTVLVDPRDLWLHTNAEEQAKFNDEFGNITAGAVVEAAKALAASKPHLARPNTDAPPTARPLEGLRPGASPEARPKKPTSWAAALHGRTS